MATVYKRGRVWWAAGFDRYGQRWQRSTKQTDERAARQVATRLEHELADEANRPRDEACTLEIAVATLLNFAKTAKRTPETLEFLETKARHLKRVFGPRRLCVSITPALTSAYAQKRISEEGAHPHTVQKEIRVLVQMLRRAAKLHLYKPAIEPRDLKPDEVRDAYKPRDRWLNEHEYRLLLAELDPQRGGRTRRRRLTRANKAPVTVDDVTRLGSIGSREHWSEEMARTVLLAWAHSAQPMRAFARAHGFDVKRLLWWRERLGMRDELDAVSVSAAASLDARELEEDRRDYLIVLCQTGARLKELYGIQAEHVDFRRMSLFLAAGTKTKKARRAIPITPVVAETLQGRIDRFGSAPLFPVWDKVTRDLHAACLRIERQLNPEKKRAAGLEGGRQRYRHDVHGNPPPKSQRVRPVHPFDPVTPNDLRRTYASWLAQAGVPHLEAVKLMGHGSSQMLERVYAQFSPKHLQDAVALLPASITGVRTTPATLALKADFGVSDAPVDP